MPDSAERLRAAMAARGVHAALLARRLGIPRQTVQVWRSRGLERADAARFVALCEYLNVRARWIISGRGRMTAAGVSVDIGPMYILRLSRQLEPEALDLWVRLGAMLVSNRTDIGERKR